jgi:arginine/ornithine N-succinyltransferase beta subunit
MQNPARFITPQTDIFRTGLAQLASQGRFMFILSNYPPKFTDEVLAFAIGGDWQEVFNLCLTKTKGSLFFKM